MEPEHLMQRELQSQLVRIQLCLPNGLVRPYQVVLQVLVKVDLVPVQQLQSQKQEMVALELVTKLTT